MGSCLPAISRLFRRSRLTGVCALVSDSDDPNTSQTVMKSPLDFTKLIAKYSEALLRCEIKKEDNREQHEEDKLWLQARTVYCDGACRKNSKTGIWNGGIGIFWGPYNKRNMCLSLTGKATNVRAELRAVILALTQASRLKF
ncbi:hypothetical protein AB6A40_008856 [Gnathostoma spinigerum]|uniref:ribonuclease H n=1 Tax=Gnathostoma spinigerum TaxID=75299 RepID=A0ABD6EZM1_9BILA